MRRARDRARSSCVRVLVILLERVERVFSKEDGEETSPFLQEHIVSPTTHLHLYGVLQGKASQLLLTTLTFQGQKDTMTEKHGRGLPSRDHGVRAGRVEKESRL